MSLLASFNPAPAIRPQMNVGCLFDIPTGTYYIGQHGESILNGGVPNITGAGGRGNVGKTMLIMYFILICMDRYPCVDASLYDSESALQQARIRHLAQRFPHLSQHDIFELERMVISDPTTMAGEVWFTAIKNYLLAKLKVGKSAYRTTPFFIKLEALKILRPTIAAIDSFSQWIPAAVVEMQGKEDVGSSKLNTEAMAAGKARSQLMSQLPTIAPSTSAYFFLTAHLGDAINMDPHAPSKKKLSDFKGDEALKRTPENFTFLTNQLWMCKARTTLKKQGTKELEYPLGTAAESEGDTDLGIIHVQIFRGKSGPTGRVLEIITSQSDGVLPHLTQFHYIKESDRYGLGGNVQNYYLELCPDVALSRTVVRRKIDENAVLRRAIEITSEMCQLADWWKLPPELKCTPKQLYEELKAKGYDWSVLLNTRGYWMFEEDIQPDTLPFLSTMDLLLMRLDRYRPYWYDRLLKASNLSDTATPVSARANLKSKK